MSIELWVRDEYLDEKQVIKNAPCVPPIAATMDMPWGRREVYALQYDFHPDSGDVRVHVKVQYPRS